MSDLLKDLRWAVETLMLHLDDDGTRDTKLSRAFSLLSTPDALLWRLLEERAGEVVEVVWV